MARTLDRDRDYGESFGGGPDEARYHQDDLWFDAAGKIMPGQKEPARKRVEPPAEPVIEPDPVMDILKS